MTLQALLCRTTPLSSMSPPASTAATTAATILMRAPLAALTTTSMSNRFWGSARKAPQEESIGRLITSSSLTLRKVFVEGSHRPEIMANGQERKQDSSRREMFPSPGNLLKIVEGLAESKRKFHIYALKTLESENNNKAHAKVDLRLPERTIMWDFVSW